MDANSQQNNPEIFPELQSIDPIEFLMLQKDRINACAIDPALADALQLSIFAIAAEFRSLRAQRQ